VADLYIVGVLYGAGANVNGAQKSAVMCGLKAGAQPVHVIRLPDLQYSTVNHTPHDRMTHGPINGPIILVKRELVLRGYPAFLSSLFPD
jgi:hypothetical protein